MPNIIKPKRSSVVGKIPTTNDIDIGEIALNMADSKIYYKDSNNIVKQITTDINNLSSVVISSPSINNILLYNGTNWINGSLNSIIEW